MKYAFSAVALAAALISGAVHAADLPSRKAPPPAAYAPPPVFTWTGFYGGLNLGGGWFNRGFRNGGAGYVIGGGQLGYNYQITPLFVAGLETDFQGASSRLHWLGTVRGRVGVTPFSPNLFFYGTGGFAYGGVSQGYFNPWSGYGYASVNTGTGWTAGGGAEWAFLPNWSAKIEYLYADISGDNDNGWGYNGWGGRYRHTTSNLVRAGVNYHFNFLSPAPSVSKY